MELLKKYCDDLKIYIEENTLDKLQAYYEMLLEKNESVNLTAITDKREIIIKHFLDSLSFKFVANKENSRLIDIGSGGGLPGIPVAIDNPGVDVTLLESVGKKANFLSDVIFDLKLDNCHAICGRAEDLARDDSFRENFDICTSRGVARLNSLLEYQLPFLKIGGCAVCYKSTEGLAELEEARNAIDLLGGEFSSVIDFSLPENMGKRLLVVIKKIKPTPLKYPRRAGVPTKRPL